MDGKYCGFKEITFDENGVNKLFEPDFSESFGCLTNEYMVARDSDGNLLTTLRWNGDSFSKVIPRGISSRFLGKVRAKNIHQQLAIDLLYNDGITVKMLSGTFGSGKTFLLCAAAVDMIERKKFDKIVYIRNNIEVKDSKPIGYLPGSFNEKMLPFAMPLADHLGGVDGLNIMVGNGQIEIVHLGFLRGRDIKNSIIICSEAENMTKEHMQLLLGRVGTGSALWIDGDIRQQDSGVFERNSGMTILKEKLKGNPLFGMVNLVKTERSETAALADLLD